MVKLTLIFLFFSSSLFPKDSFIDVIVCLRCYAVLCEDIRNDIYDYCPRLKELLDEHVN